MAFRNYDVSLKNDSVNFLGEKINMACKKNTTQSNSAIHPNIPATTLLSPVLVQG